MRRIALVTPIFPSTGDPTRGRFIYETARSLSSATELRVFLQQPRYFSFRALTPRTQLGVAVERDYTFDGITVSTVNYRAVKGMTRAINGLLGSAALLPRLREFQPEIVIAYWVYPEGFAAVRAARKLGIPCVVGALGTDIHVRSGLNIWLTRRTIAGADALLTVSEDMRRTAIAKFGALPERVHTVINGINTSVFFPVARERARTALGLDPQVELIVYVGRLVATKGLGELIEAMIQLVRSRPAMQLALIGDGAMRAQLNALIAAAGLTGRVYLAGGLPPQQVAQWINASDLLTLPSWSEGYPNVVVEAIACGRPVVATDVGGTREIVNESNGVLIPPRQVAALTAGLEHCLSTRWDHAAIAAAMRRTWGDVSRETLAICETVLTAHRRSA